MGEYDLISELCDICVTLLRVVEAQEGALLQLGAVAAALGAEIVDASPCGLTAGDLRVGGKWTRNVDGTQTVLSERPTYDELVAALAALGVTK